MDTDSVAMVLLYNNTLSHPVAGMLNIGRQRKHESIRASARLLSALKSAIKHESTTYRLNASISSLSTQNDLRFFCSILFVGTSLVERPAIDLQWTRSALQLWADEVRNSDLTTPLVNIVF
jgi:hypothetical protein